MNMKYVRVINNLINILVLHITAVGTSIKLNLKYFMWRWRRDHTTTIKSNLPNNTTKTAPSLSTRVRIPPVSPIFPVIQSLVAVLFDLALSLIVVLSHVLIFVRKHLGHRLVWKPPPPGRVWGAGRVSGVTVVTTGVVVVHWGGGVTTGVVVVSL